ncbi:MAG TPA: phage tail protein I, partial [Kaistiaceae bacterium]|nr:phage tail protein I [Kaistiaceae bacterium]
MMANSTTAVSILPTNSTPWEIAVDLTSAERHPWPVDVIRDVWDPWKCPEHLLPYLAASLSVDLWNPTWPVETKRLVIDKAIWLHRHKGTLAGIRETTQLLLDLHVVDGATFIHPLKVDGRSSPTMFVPHLVSGDTASPVTSSEASARLSLSRGRRRVLPDHWLQVVEEAFDALDADPSAQASAHQR